MHTIRGVLPYLGDASDRALKDRPRSQVTLAAASEMCGMKARDIYPLTSPRLIDGGILSAPGSCELRRWLFHSFSFSRHLCASPPNTSFTAALFFLLFPPLLSSPAFPSSLCCREASRGMRPHTCASECECLQSPLPQHHHGYSCVGEIDQGSSGDHVLLW